MNALSYLAAANCENARTPTCVCRCGGKAHGRRSTADVGTLPTFDPHYPAADMEKRGRETRRIARKMAGWYRRLPERLARAGDVVPS